MLQPSLITATEIQRVCVMVQGMDAFDVTGSILQVAKRGNSVGTS